MSRDQIEEQIALAWREHAREYEEKMERIDAARRELEQQQREEAEEETYESELCPCGHMYDQHYMGGGHCTVCDCPQFGESVENWETYTEVNLGGDPGGFKIYE
jgi:uncharacterized protein YyaL (SSP411 family)